MFDNIEYLPGVEAWVCFLEEPFEGNWVAYEGFDVQSQVGQALEG